MQAKYILLLNMLSQSTINVQLGHPSMDISVHTDDDVLITPAILYIFYYCFVLHSNLNAWN